MVFVADVLLVAGALGAGLYCHVLSRRLRRFTDLESGVGGAVAILSAQVDDLGKALSKAQTSTNSSVEAFAEVNLRAESSARRLELLIASMHDIPKEEPTKYPENPFFVRRSNGERPTQ